MSGAEVRRGGGGGKINSSSITTRSKSVVVVNLHPPTGNVGNPIPSNVVSAPVRGSSAARPPLPIPAPRLKTLHAPHQPRLSGSAQQPAKLDRQIKFVAAQSHCQGSVASADDCLAATAKNLNISGGVQTKIGTVMESGSVTTRSQYKKNQLLWTGLASNSGQKNPLGVTSGMAGAGADKFVSQVGVEGTMGNESSTQGREYELRCVNNINVPSNGNPPETSMPNKLRRVTTEDVQLMWNVDRCNCQFCGEDLLEKEGVMLNSCLHVFCKNCIKSSAELQGGIQAKCPLNDGSNQCEGFLMEQELKEILTTEVYQEYLEKSMKFAKQNMNNILECLTPNCGGWCEFEKGNQSFLCYLCSKINCLSCMAIHDGMNCNAYKAIAVKENSSQEAGNLPNYSQNGWEQLQSLIAFKNWVRNINPSPST